MKARIIISTALIAACVLGISAKSPKRGVSENQFQYKAQMEALTPGCCWYYTWGNAPGRYIADTEYLEFVPMCWNGGYNADNIRTYVKEHPQVKYLLGFNEPNFSNQADMTPAEAAAEWPRVRALADELGLKLVAPALNYSPDPPYQSPTAWMDEFVKLVGNDAFDYLAVHSYGGFGVMKEISTTFHERYGKDVWLTEFCYWPGENSNTYVSPTSQISTMMQSLEWLEKTEWIYRYAWFKPVGASDLSTGPNYGLIKSGKGEEKRELSQQGLVYCYLPDFNVNEYHKVGETIAATDYISQKGCVAGGTNWAECPKPIEITQFNSGASIDWQFDVPAEDDYTLMLTVSGVGEPVRFDPSLSVVAPVDEETDGEVLLAAKNYEITGDDNVYKTLYLPLHLKAGKQTLRLRDAAPYAPSGLHIAGVQLATTAGVGEIDAETGDAIVDVYNTQGIMVRRGVLSNDATRDLPAGIYIAGGRKVLVK